MDSKEFTPLNFKDIELNGYMLFTDAVETGEDVDFAVIITPDSKPGIDAVLMDAGFDYYHDRCYLPEKLFWMSRGEKENLRYHPLRQNSFNSRTIKVALANGMRTRIDFFCREPGNSAYDVVMGLIGLGYRVLAFPPQGYLIQKLFLIAQGANNVPSVTEVQE